MNFEEQQETRRKEVIEEYENIYGRISKKIHPAFFDSFQSKGEDIYKEAEELFHDLEGIKFQKGWQNTDGETVDSIEAKMKELDDFEKRVDEFIARNSSVDRENEDGNADDNSKAGGSEKDATSNEEEQHGQDDAYAKRKRWTDDFSRGPVSKKENGGDDANQQKDSISKEEWIGRFSGFYKGKENQDKDADKEGEKSESSGGERNENKNEVNADSLNSEVENARKAYAAKSYEMSGNLSSWKRFLRIEKTNSEDLAKSTYEYAAYQEALRKLIEFKVNEAKSKRSGLSSIGQIARFKESEKELEEIYRYFKVDEKVKLYSAYTDAKLQSKVKDREGRELTMKEKAFDFGEKAVKWYKELPTKYKIAVSVSLLAGGFVAGTMGAAGAVTAFGVLKASQRGMGGAAAGVGMVGAQEQARRWMERRQAGKEWKKEKVEIADSFGTYNDEEVYNRMSEKLLQEINGYDESLKTEIKRSGGRKVIGAALGIVIGSGAMAHVVKAFGMGSGHHSEIGSPKIATDHSVSIGSTEANHSSIGTGVENAKDAVNGEHIKPGPGADEIYKELVDNDNNKTPANIPSASAAPVVENVTEHHEGTELSIGKGGNLEKSLINHLTSQGIDKKEAGKMAHRMALDFAKERGIPKGAFSLVHDGTKIHLSPDGKHIIGIDGDKRLGWIEKDTGGHKRFSFASSEQRAAAGIKTVAENNHSSEVPHAAPQNVPGHAPTESPQPAGTVESGNADDVIYRSMPEALRSGVNEIDNRFGLSGRVAGDLEEYRKITEEMKAVRIDSRFIAEDRLLAPSHDFSEFKDLSELRTRLADIDNRLNSPDLDAESPIEDDLIRQKMLFESTIKLQEERDIALDGLRKQQALCLRKIASGLRQAMFDGDAKIYGDPQQIANVDARDYLNDPVAVGRGGKIIGIYQSLMKLPEGKAFEPKFGERMDVWTRRIIIALMKSKGLKFY